MSEDVKKTPTWGYKGEESKLFSLGPDDTLPEGWADSPTPTEAAEPAASTEPEAEVSADGFEGGVIEKLNAQEAEIASLTEQLEAANARIAELESEGEEDPDLTIPHPGAPKEPTLIEIPEDWASTGPGLHFARIKLAKALAPDMVDSISSDSEAIEVIEAEIKRRG